MLDKTLLAVLLALFFISCKENQNITVTDVMKPQTVIYENEKQDYIDTFNIEYLGNRLKSMQSKHKIFSYTYSEKKVSEFYYYTGDTFAWGYAEFLLNNEHKVYKIEYYQNVNADFNVWTGPQIDSYYKEPYYYLMEYLNDGTVKKQFLYEGWNKDEYMYELLKYDAAGNLETITDYNYQDNYYIQSIDSLFYDNQHHQFKNISNMVNESSETRINNLIARKKTSYITSWSSSEGLAYLDTTYSSITIDYHLNEYGFPTYIEEDEMFTEIIY